MTISPSKGISAPFMTHCLAHLAGSLAPTRTLAAALSRALKEMRVSDPLSDHTHPWSGMTDQAIITTASIEFGLLSLVQTSTSPADQGSLDMQAWSAATDAYKLFWSVKEPEKRWDVLASAAVLWTVLHTADSPVTREGCYVTLVERMYRSEHSTFQATRDSKGDIKSLLLSGKDKKQDGRFLKVQDEQYGKRDLSAALSIFQQDLPEVFEDCLVCSGYPDGS